jgi:hypothetical protein
MHRLKIVALATALIILITGSAAAQGLIVEPAIGVKAGINASNFEVTGTGTSKRSGFVGGAFASAPLGQMTLQFEALYSQKGFNKSSYEGYNNWESKVDYLELPLTLNVSIPMDSVTPYFYGGFSLGIQLSAETKHSGTDDQWVDTSDALKSPATAFILGVGLRINRIYLDARFNHGLTDLNDTDGGSEVKDRTFAFTAGYAIWM